MMIMPYIPHSSGGSRLDLEMLAREMKKSFKEAIREESEHQRALEAKAWVKKATKERQKEETKAFWEWMKEAKK